VGKKLDRKEIGEGGQVIQYAAAHIKQEFRQAGLASGKIVPNKAIDHNTRHVEENKLLLASDPLPSTDMDDYASGRAAAVYQEEFDKWEGLINAIAGDFGLSREQRATGIMALRGRQQAAAKGAQQRVMEEEKQKVKAFRRYKQQLAAPLARCSL
jgi:hypothetical protein